MSQGFFTNGVQLAAGQLTGTELLPADGASGSVGVSAAQLAGAIPACQYSGNGSVSGFTAAGADVAGAALTVLGLTGTLTADAVVTMPSATAMAGAIGGAYSGVTYVLRVINRSSGAFQWTIAGNASVGIVGTASIAQNSWREFLVTFNSALTTATLRNIGGGDVA